jgi:hypothetical protein
VRRLEKCQGELEAYLTPPIATRLFKKLPNFSKQSQNSCQVKKAKISTSKLILKVYNIYIKPLLNLKMPTTSHVLKLPI